jgi:enolase
MGAEVFHALRGVLRERGLATGVGDEGGFAPSLASNQDAIEVILRAIEAAGYRPGQDAYVAIDAAATELYDRGKYRLAKEGRELSAEEMVDFYADWVGRYPIVSIEDPLAEDDWEGWRALAARIGGRVQLVGDDLFVTNVERISRGIAEQADRDAGRDRHDAARFLAGRDLAPFRRDRGRLDRPPGGRDERRPDQDRRALARRAGREV